LDSSTDLEPEAVEVENAARVFAALAEPARLRVLAVLATPSAACAYRLIDSAANLGWRRAGRCRLRCVGGPAGRRRA